MKSALRLFEVVDDGRGPVLRGDFFLTIPIERAKVQGPYCEEGCEAGFAQVVGRSFAFAVPKDGSITEVAKFFTQVGERMATFGKGGK